MRFTLHYEGSVKAESRDAEHIHDIRGHFHQQLAVLWSRPPLESVAGNFLKPTEDDGRKDELHVIKKVGAFEFAPLGSERLKLFAELAFTILRPGPPGSLFAKGGDIDNSLKTLFDALKVPDPSQLPRDAQPANGERPFFCLLEDDKLIKNISVETDSLLSKCVSDSHAVVLIHVITRASELQWKTLGISG